MQSDVRRHRTGKNTKQKCRRSGPGDFCLKGPRGTGLTGGSSRTPRKSETHSNSRRDKTRYDLLSIRQVGDHIQCMTFYNPTENCKHCRCK